MSRGRDVLSRDAAGHVLIDGDLEDGWLRWEKDKDKDLRSQRAPKATGMLMGSGEEERNLQS